jgi:hypothetical protein
MNDAATDFIRVGTLGELRNRRRMVIGTPGGPVLTGCTGARNRWLDAYITYYRR